jgi:hypothetical protein
VFAGDTVQAVPRPESHGPHPEPARPQPGPAETAVLPVPRQATAQDLADCLVRYGTWLPAAPPAGPHGAQLRWVGTPLRVVRGQDRTTVDRRNDLAYDGLLVTDHD